MTDELPSADVLAAVAKLQAELDQFRADVTARIDRLEETLAQIRRDVRTYGR